MKTRRRPAARAVTKDRTRGRTALSKFARSLLREWRRLQLPFKNEQIIVGVSGGTDSVALLMALAELTNARKLDLTLIVSHVDHRLRKTSGEDSRWVKNLAQALDLQVVISRVDVKSRKDNLEQAARPEGLMAFRSVLVREARGWAAAGRWARATAWRTTSRWRTTWPW